MKNAMRVLLPILCLLFLALIVFTTVKCVTDYQKLSAEPGVSGIDFFMFGVGYGINCLAYSLLGLFAAVFHRKITKKLMINGVEAGFAPVFICLFSLTLAASVGIFYL